MPFRQVPRLGGSWKLSIGAMVEIALASIFRKGLEKHTFEDLTDDMASTGWILEAMAVSNVVAEFHQALQRNGSSRYCWHTTGLTQQVHKYRPAVQTMATTPEEMWIWSRRSA